MRYVGVQALGRVVGRGGRGKDSFYGRLEDDVCCAGALLVHFGAWGCLESVRLATRGEEGEAEGDGEASTYRTGPSSGGRR